MTRKREPSAHADWSPTFRAQVVRFGVRLSERKFP